MLMYALQAFLPQPKYKRVQKTINQAYILDKPTAGKVIMFYAYTIMGIKSDC